MAPGPVGRSPRGQPPLGALTCLPLPCGLPRLGSRAEGRSAPSPYRPQADLLRAKAAGSWPGRAAHAGCRPEPTGFSQTHSNYEAGPVCLVTPLLLQPAQMLLPVLLSKKSQNSSKQTQLRVRMPASDPEPSL